MYDEIIYATLSGVAERLLADGITDSKILQYTSLSQEQLDTIRDIIQTEKRKAEEYENFITGLQALVRELIFTSKGDLLSDEVKKYCNCGGRIIPILELEEIIQTAYKEKAIGNNFDI